MQVSGYELAGVLVGRVLRPRIQTRRGIERQRYVLMAVGREVAWLAILVGEFTGRVGCERQGATNLQVHHLPLVVP